MLQISPSQMNEVRICTARYYYSRILKLPKPKVEAAAYGSAIDNTLEDMINDKIGHVLKPVEHYFARLSQHFAKQMDGVEITDERRAELYAWAIAHVKGFYASELPDLKALAVQQRCEWDTEEFRMVGIMDLVTDKKVIDFKCLTKRLPRSRGMQKAKSDDHLLQMYTYHYGYRELFGREPEQLELWYFQPLTLLKDGTPKGKPEIVKVPVNFVAIEDQMEFMAVDAWEKIRGVREEGKYWPNRSKYNFLCSEKFCPFWSKCVEEFPLDAN